MSREDNNKHLADAAEWLKDHSYTELANAAGVEVWRCQKPGSIHQAFDICMTRFGIAAFGDIGSLTFSVGASYGFPFLAGKDGDYIYEKLEASSKATDFDRLAFVGHVESAICDLLSGSRELAPEWMANWSTNQGRGTEIEAWLLDNCAVDGELSALVVALREAWAFEDGADPAKAHDWLSEHEELLETSDSWEWRLRKPTSAVLRRLAKVRHAARVIVAQKAAATAQAVAL